MRGRVVVGFAFGGGMGMGEDWVVGIFGCIGSFTFFVVVFFGMEIFGPISVLERAVLDGRASRNSGFPLPYALLSCEARVGLCMTYHGSQATELYSSNASGDLGGHMKAHVKMTLTSSRTRLSNGQVSMAFGAREGT